MKTYIHHNEDNDSVNISLDSDEIRTIGITTYGNHTAITIRFPNRGDARKFVEMINNADEFDVGGHAVDSELSAAEADWEFELENCINCDKPLNSQGTCDECNKGMPDEWIPSIPKLDGWKFDLIKGD